MTEPHVFRHYAPIFFADPRDTLGGLRSKVPGGITTAMTENEADWERAWHQAAIFFDHDDQWMVERFSDIAAGTWSLQALRAEHGIKDGELRLSPRWVHAASGFVCPCCGRSKNELVTKSKHGNWVGRLTEHHDHGAVPRFGRTLICESCNVAEAAIKSLLGLPKTTTSFTPDEIRQFIQIQPHQPHGLNRAAARAIWEARRAGDAAPVAVEPVISPDDVQDAETVKLRIRELRPDLADFEVDLHYIAFLLRSTGDHLFAHGWCQTARYEMRREAGYVYGSVKRPVTVAPAAPPFARFSRPFVPATVQATPARKPPFARRVVLPATVAA